MMTAVDVAEATQEVVRRQHLQGHIARVLATATTASTGDPAWRIKLVVEPNDVTGDQAIDLLVGIRNELEKRGEDGFPIVEYATEQDLAEEAAELGTETLDEDD